MNTLGVGKTDSSPIDLSVPLNRNRKLSIVSIVNEIDKIFSSLKEDQEYILLENIDKHHAYDVMERYGKRACRFHFSNGLLNIKKIPGEIHEVAASSIMDQLTLSNIKGFKTGSGPCIINQTTKQPDAGFKPKNRQTSGPFSDGKALEFPTLVIVIGSLDLLEDELQNWVSNYTTVNIAIGIKIGHLENGTRTLIFLMFTRGKPDKIEIDLQSNEKQSIQIPMSLLFQCGQDPNDLAEEFFNLNLMSIRDEINEKLTEELTEIAV